MINVKIFFLALFLNVFCQDDICTLKYNGDNFSQEIQKKNHFIMFYAPWCSHCKQFAPIWDQLAEMLNEDDNNIKIAKVDCTVSSDICAQQDITGYPTLKFFKQDHNSGLKFRGSRDLPTLTNFINEQLRLGKVANEVESELKPAGGLYELTEENFDKHVSIGKHFVKFYAPWCSHCQIFAPIWEQLTKSLITSDANIAKIDCNIHRSICNNFEVKGYPTLIWIEDGKKVDKYKGNRNLDDLKLYVENMLGSDKRETKETEEFSTIEDSDELTTDTFKSRVQKGISFVKFFAPWCGHCKRLSPIWNSLRQTFKKQNGVNIFKVDCNSNVNKVLCKSEQIESFPTLLLYKDGFKLSEYRGSRSIEDLTDFVNKHLIRDEL